MSFATNSCDNEGILRNIQALQCKAHCLQKQICDLCAQKGCIESSIDCERCKALQLIRCYLHKLQNVQCFLTANICQACNISLNSKLLLSDIERYISCLKADEKRLCVAMWCRVNGVCCPPVTCYPDPCCPPNTCRPVCLPCNPCDTNCQPKCKLIAPDPCSPCTPCFVVCNPCDPCKPCYIPCDPCKPTVCTPCDPCDPCKPPVCYPCDPCNPCKPPVCFTCDPCDPCKPPVCIPCDPCDPCKPSVCCPCDPCDPCKPSVCCPCDPCDPCKPSVCCPCDPCNPCKPLICGPCDPCNPCKMPCSPCLPCGPCKPCDPCPPCGPSYPCVPCPPCGPCYPCYDPSSKCLVPHNIGRGGSALFDQLCSDLWKCAYLPTCCPQQGMSCGTRWVRVIEVHPTGKYVQLTNTSYNRPEEIGSHYLIQQQVGGCPLNVFRFPPKVHLPPQATIKVWSCCNDPKLNKPPTDFVFQQLLRWNVGADISTLLCRPNGQAIAWLAGCNVLCKDPCSTVPAPWFNCAIPSSLSTRKFH